MTTNTPEQAAFNIDDILDGTLDDLADMPEFKPYPPGAHKAKLKIEQKVISGFPAMEVAMTGIETLELANPTDVPLQKGDETSVIYFMKHSNPKTQELGQGQFKELMKSAALVFPDAKTNRERIDLINGMDEWIIVTGTRQNKEKTKTYTDLQAISDKIPG